MLSVNKGLVNDEYDVTRDSHVTTESRKSYRYPSKLPIAKVFANNLFC